MGRPSKREKPPFALNIIARRKGLGWNAHQLAEMAEIPYPTLRDIEGGVNAGREDTKSKIAKALKCSVADLYDTGEVSAPVRPPPHELTTLIEAPERALHSTVASILKELLITEPDVRAATLAVLYGDNSIARPYGGKKTQGSK